MINFTIDSTSYQAEEGMTWGEWVDSEYSGNMFGPRDGGVAHRDGRDVFASRDNPVNLKDTITPNHQYLLITGGAN